MDFDYTGLRAVIKEKYNTFGAFALAMRVPYQRMSRLLTGKASWHIDEAYEAAVKLGILEDFGTYFFTLKSH